MDTSSLDRLKYLGLWPRTLLDVGAHVGSFSVEFLKRFGGCAATLVEANPYCREHLERTGLPFHLVAASDRNGRAQLNLTRENAISTGTSLYREATEHFDDGKLATVEVDVVRLDDLFPGRAFDFVKIDVQGAELDVIRGAGRILRTAEHVLIELSLAEYNTGGALADAVIAEMAKLGFRLDDALEYHRFPHLYDGAIFQIDFLFVPRWRRPAQRGMFAANGSRDGILGFLRGEKARDPGFTVIDVGASANPWSKGIADAVFDRTDYGVAARHLGGDLNREADWQPVLEHVAQHGRYSYAICSHTLEDLAYPAVTLKYLPLIADAGFIAVPSVATELARIEGEWRGYIHHRWLISVAGDGRLRFSPKIPMIEHLPPVAPPQPLTELQLTWQGGLAIEFLNDGYLGPTPKHVVDMYRTLHGEVAR